MCCFSGPVNSVNKTNIFVRRTSKSHQAVVYSMSIDTPTDVAMILPIPVAKGTGEKDVTFVNLEKYKHFFKDMAKGFPRPKSLANSKSRGIPAPPSDSLQLKVVSVGAFEASFVPSPADFARLDKRFRLPTGTFERLPGYASFGFAVFKLKKGRSDVHPMAFRFPTRWPEKLFFPTVHIHDGKIHKSAKFDHSLFLQANVEEDKPLRGWMESPKVASGFMDVKESQAIVNANDHCYWRRVRGRRANTDITV